MVGLGRMGASIAARLTKNNITVIGFDIHEQVRQKAGNEGVQIADSLITLAQKVDVVWLMVPAGVVIDAIIKDLLPGLSKSSIVIDGGNSHFTDSIKRAEQLAASGITFIDCGTSGGVHGRTDGFCLMIGGDKTAYIKLEPVWKAVAAPNGFAHVGPSGAGHYVKMVHNGIEYALMQAYAEGLHLLHESRFGVGALSLLTITDLWNHGAVIRSFLLQLAHRALKDDQSLKDVGGQVAETGMGHWTVQEAHERGVPVKMMEDALTTRAWSRETGGNYATKIIALLRQQFGGHALTHLKGQDV